MDNWGFKVVRAYVIVGITKTIKEPYVCDFFSLMFNGIKQLVYLSTRQLLHKFPCWLFCCFINNSYLCPKFDDTRRWQSVLIRCYWRYLLKSNSRKVWIGTKMIAMAPHHWLCVAIIGSIHIPLVWVAIVLSVPKAMREARFQDNLKSASNLNGNLNCSKEFEHYASW